jgi:hypothetical protein
MKYITAVGLLGLAGASTLRAQPAVNRQKLDSEGV